jgi:RecB family exonuclease
VSRLLPQPFVFTQSNLQAFINCPYQFYLRYVLHFQWPAAQARDMLQFEADRLAGARFHQLVHQLFLGVSLPKLSQIAKNDPDSRVAIWFNAFTTAFSQTLPGELFTEYTLGVTLGGQELTAKYDLLQRDGENFTIYDWKTSHKQPSKKWLTGQMQSRVFPLVLALHLGEINQPFIELRMVYWEAAQPERPYIFKSTAQTLAEDQDYIFELMQKINRLSPADFHKTDDIQRCRYCRYRSYCNRGAQPPEEDGAFIEAHYLELADEPEDDFFEVDFL